MDLLDQTSKGSSVSKSKRSDCSRRRDVVATIIAVSLSMTSACSFVMVKGPSASVTPQQVSCTESLGWPLVDGLLGTVLLVAQGIAAKDGDIEATALLGGLSVLEFTSAYVGSRRVSACREAKRAMSAPAAPSASEGTRASYGSSPRPPMPAPYGHAPSGRRPTEWLAVEGLAGGGLWLGEAKDQLSPDTDSRILGVSGVGAMLSLATLRWENVFWTIFEGGIVFGGDEIVITQTRIGGVTPIRGDLQVRYGIGGGWSAMYRRFDALNSELGYAGFAISPTLVVGTERWRAGLRLLLPTFGNYDEDLKPLVGLFSLQLGL